jgi:hypothetical protein
VRPESPIVRVEDNYIDLNDESDLSIKSLVRDDRAFLLLQIFLEKGFGLIPGVLGGLFIVARARRVGKGVAGLIFRSSEAWPLAHA